MKIKKRTRGVNLLSALIVVCCAINTCFAQTEWKEVKTLHSIPSLDNNDDKFGTSVAISNEILVVGSPQNNLEGSVFILSNDGRYDTLGILSASYGSVGDNFGVSVSMHGDIIVVGANRDDDRGYLSGSAYVFVKPESGWASMTETAKLTATGTNYYHFFGSSVSIYENTVVVGAYGDNNDKGAVYIYERPQSGWKHMTETSKITASDGEDNDYFGCSTFIYENTILVGAYGDDDNGNHSGSAYVFTKPVTGWKNMTESAKILASDGTANNYFGYSVCIYGNTLVVGANRDDKNALLGGAVYIFDKPQLGWENMTETAKLYPSNSHQQQFFGYSVSIKDSIVVVGATEDESNSGYVFIRPESGWKDTTESIKLTASASISSDNFGCSVGIADSTIIIGAQKDNVISPNSGAVYIFENPINDNNLVNESIKINAINPHPTNSYDYFGSAVDISNEIIAVGTNYKSKGNVHVFANYPPYDTLAILSASDSKINDHFGSSISISDSLIVVGAYGDDDYGAESGSVYIFEKPMTGWRSMTETAKLSASNGTGNYKFGENVSLTGSTIAVLSRGAETGRGSVYIFKKPNTGWIDSNEDAILKVSDSLSSFFSLSLSMHNDVVVLGGYKASCIFEKPESGWINSTETAILTASDKDSSNYFGWSVSIDNNSIAIGVNDAIRNGKKLGAVYLFEKPETGWENMTETAKLYASDGEESDSYGSSVSMYNDRIIAGAPLGRNPSGSRGSVYVFERPETGWTDMIETNKIESLEQYKLPLFGQSIAINSKKIVSGAILDDNKGMSSGAVHVYEEKEYCYDTIFRSVCNSYNSPGGDHIWDSSGVYLDTIVGESECVTIVTVVLTINKTASEIDITAGNQFISPSRKYIWAESGTYLDTISNYVGCDSIIKIELNIIPIDTSVNVIDNSLSANVSNANYTWINCDNNEIIDGETSQSYVPSESGNYAVIIEQNGCADTSRCYSILLSGTIYNSFDQNISFYPNPTKDNIFIKLDKVYNEIDLEVFTLEGQVIKKENYRNKRNITLELEEGTGIYLLKIHTNSGERAFVKLVKE